MPTKSISDMLMEAQMAAYNAHTDQIKRFIDEFENDDLVKMLIDERRITYHEFEKRIQVANKLEE